MQFHKTLLDKNNQLADGSGEAVAAAAQVVRVWEGMDSEGSGGAASPTAHAAGQGSVGLQSVFHIPGRDA